MRRVFVGLVGLALAGTSAGLGLTAFAANAVEAAAAVPAVGEATPSDSLPNPLGDKQSALRERAVSEVIHGNLTPEMRNGSKVVKVGTAAGTGNGNKPEQYVHLARETTDRIFIVLAQFGNTRHPSYPDIDIQPSTPGPITWNGPLINQIPQPDRSLDNSTVWQPNYNKAHFEDIYFGSGESLKTYYEAMSSGRYSVEGTVTDWTTVAFNQARYGRSNGFPCGSNVCSNTWNLIRDAPNKWYADQIAAGRSAASIKAELESFDVWDRYDYDGDGNFNESDGYVDHFQIVHAGGDQADGDPTYGEDAIWSHRWYANQIFNGTVGPAYNPVGGFQVGTTGIWVADYTIQPENGGRSVFFHEYGHDLGLPDDYNIISGGDNNNEHWTLMAQSRLGAATDGGIGERAGDLGAWNKLMLGWLNYEAFLAGDKRTVDLGPEEYNSNRAQAAIVILPQKAVVTNLGAPASGSFQFYSGDGDDMDNSLSRQVTLPAGAVTLSFNARWDIEDCGSTPCDYAYVEVNSGSGYTAIPGSITNAAEDDGIDGTQASYVNATFDLSAYAGTTVGLRFRYATDGAVAGNDDTVANGFFVDDIAITGGFTDGAEAGLGSWAADGFSIVGASVTHHFNHYYIAGNRSYVSYDQYLQTGPYYFGYLNTRPDFVDHYAYQQGLLISYWDTSYGDNDTFAHPGNGRNLYIDAHPAIMYRTDGLPWRSRVQVHDAPFGLVNGPSFSLHQNSVLMPITGQPAQPIFDDTGTYWYAALPNHGVKLPAVGVTARVLVQNGTYMVVRFE
ncbi:MAG: immune inhibitor A domain-containing protein [Micromonosporaceae bacterium]